jgi:hypothetical protein
MALSSQDSILTALLPDWYLLLQRWSVEGALTAAAQVNRVLAMDANGEYG